MKYEIQESNKQKFILTKRQHNNLSFKQFFRKYHFPCFLTLKAMKYDIRKQGLSCIMYKFERKRDYGKDRIYSDRTT